jgi:DnaK suppressor protein
MESERARDLLALERERIETALGLHNGPPVEGDANIVAGDDDGEGLYQDEMDAGRREDLKQQLAALERAEERLANGTYGLSVKSGQQIPDARLEARPTAELTVEEQQAQGGT